MFDETHAHVHRLERKTEMKKDEEEEDVRERHAHMPDTRKTRTSRWFNAARTSTACYATKNTSETI